MRDIPRLLPIWCVLLLIVTALHQCGCRGGRSIGDGSAGTVIIPKTPQEINERSSLPPPPDIVFPPLEPLAPIPIVPVPLKPEKSKPVIPESKPAQANKDLFNPKTAGELKSFTPTINRNAPPVKLPPVTVKLPPVKPETKEQVNIIDNKQTSIPVIETPTSTQPLKKESDNFNWLELILNYLLFFIIIVFLVTIYDIIKMKRNKPLKNERHQNGVKKVAKKKAIRKKPAKKKVSTKTKKKNE